MAFRDYPFDAARGGGEDTRRFPGDGAVLAYLENFAKDFGTLSSIRFETSVTQVTLAKSATTDAETSPATWIVESRGPAGVGGAKRDGDAKRAKRETFDAVVVCNGHFSEPLVPELPGMESFKGKLIHSHSYRRAAAFAGQRVAVLGAKSSGIDISHELAGVARDVSLCSRDVTTTTPVPGYENLRMCPNIVGLEGQAVILEDGSRLEDVDALLFCTGYRYALPFFSESPDLVSIDEGWVHPLYLDLLSTIAPTLAFVGLPFQVVPFPLFEAQARFVAAILSGRAHLPSQADRAATEANLVERLQAKGVPRRSYFQYDERQFAYINELARRAEADPLPPGFAELKRVVAAERQRDPDGFRDKRYPALG